MDNRVIVILSDDDDDDDNGKPTVYTANKKDIVVIDDSEDDINLPPTSSNSCATRTSPEKGSLKRKRNNVEDKPSAKRKKTEHNPPESDFGFDFDIHEPSIMFTACSSKDAEPSSTKTHSPDSYASTGQSTATNPSNCSDESQCPTTKDHRSNALKQNCCEKRKRVVVLNNNNSSGTLSTGSCNHDAILNTDSKIICPVCPQIFTGKDKSSKVLTQREAPLPSTSLANKGKIESMIKTLLPSSFIDKNQVPSSSSKESSSSAALRSTSCKKTNFPSSSNESPSASSGKMDTNQPSATNTQPSSTATNPPSTCSDESQCSTSNDHRSNAPEQNCTEKQERVVFLNGGTPPTSSCSNDESVSTVSKIVCPTCPESFTGKDKSSKFLMHYKVHFYTQLSSDNRTNLTSFSNDKDKVPSSSSERICLSAFPSSSSKKTNFPSSSNVINVSPSASSNMNTTYPTSPTNTQSSSNNGTNPTSNNNSSSTISTSGSSPVSNTESEIICPVCSETTTLYTFFKHYRKSHLRSCYCAKCNQCCYVDNDHEYLKKPKHTFRCPFCVSVCSKEFRFDELVQHFNCQHKEQSSFNGGSYGCPPRYCCSVISNSPSDLLVHILMEHDRALKTVQGGTQYCHLCNGKHVHFNEENSLAHFIEEHHKVLTKEVYGVFKRSAYASMVEGIDKDKLPSSSNAESTFPLTSSSTSLANNCKNNKQSSSTSIDEDKLPLSPSEETVLSTLSSTSWNKNDSPAATIDKDKLPSLYNKARPQSSSMINDGHSTTINQSNAAATGKNLPTHMVIDLTQSHSSHVSNRTKSAPSSISGKRKRENSPCSLGSENRSSLETNCDSTTKRKVWCSTQSNNSQAHSWYERPRTRSASSNISSSFPPISVANGGTRQVLSNLSNSPSVTPQNLSMLPSYSSNESSSSSALPSTSNNKADFPSSSNESQSTSGGKMGTNQPSVTNTQPSTTNPPSTCSDESQCSTSKDHRSNALEQNFSEKQERAVIFNGGTSTSSGSRPEIFFTDSKIVCPVCPESFTGKDKLSKLLKHCILHPTTTDQSNAAATRKTLPTHAVIDRTEVRDKEPQSHSSHVQNRTKSAPSSTSEKRERENSPWLLGSENGSSLDRNKTNCDSTTTRKVWCSAQSNNSQAHSSHERPRTRSASFNISSSFPPTSVARSGPRQVLSNLSNSRSVSPQNLSKFSHIIFIDLDNWNWKRFLSLPFPLPSDVFVWGFCGGNYTLSTNKSWSGNFRVLVEERRFFQHPKCGSSKNAADFALCVHAARLDLQLPVHIPFTVLSGDKGFGELRNQLKSSPRQIHLLDPHRVDQKKLYCLLASIGQK